eukprot:13703061-Alexandrium_andersonii.AAC.1
MRSAALAATPVAVSSPPHVSSARSGQSFSLGRKPFSVALLTMASTVSSDIALVAAPVSKSVSRSRPPTRTNVRKL